MKDSTDRLLAQAPAQGGRYPVVAPFTGDVAFELPLASVSDVDEAFADARAAQSSWAALSVRERCRIFRLPASHLSAVRSDGGPIEISLR